MENIHIQTKSKEYDVHVGKESLSHLTTIVQKHAAICIKYYDYFR